MIVEMDALDQNLTCELISLQPRKKIVGCKWFMLLKLGLIISLIALKQDWLPKGMYLVVQVDDIVITRNDATKIYQLKKHLCNHLQTKDLRCLKCSLGTKVAQSIEGIIIYQRIYVVDILKETNMINFNLWIVKWIQVIR